MKARIGFGLRDDIRLLADIRDEAGPDAVVLADANHAYLLGQARALLCELGDLGVYWLEEPLPPDDVDGYRQLMAIPSPVMLAAGENNSTSENIWPLVRSRAVHILQPDLTRCGGLTGGREILALARAAGQLLTPHVWGTGVGLAAAVQFLAAVPPMPYSVGAAEPLLEFDTSEHPFRQELIKNRIVMRDGTVAVPDGPGLGVEVNREVLAALVTGAGRSRGTSVVDAGD